MTRHIVPLGPAVLVTLVLAAPGAGAAGAHVHGQGELDVAVEAGRVDLFLRAPLGDLAGEGGRDAPALEARYAAGDVFAFVGARCTLVALDVELAEVGATESEDAFGASADAHGEEAGEDGAHAGHGSKSPAGHSDGLLNWRYDCGSDPAQLSVTTLFELGRFERLLVQSIGPAGVRSVTLTPDSATLELR